MKSISEMTGRAMHVGRRTGKEMEELGAKLVFLPYTKDTSSTMLREKLKEF